MTQISFIAYTVTDKSNYKATVKTNLTLGVKGKYKTLFACTAWRYKSLS